LRLLTHRREPSKRRPPVCPGVIPAKAGIQFFDFALRALDSGFRRNDTCGEGHPNKACDLLAATRSASGVCLDRPPKGNGAPKSANPFWFAFLAGTRGHLSARQSDVLRLSRAALSPEAGVSNASSCRTMPASGRQPAPGRRPYYLRAEPRRRPGAGFACRPAGHRTPSRLTTPRETTLQRTGCAKHKGGFGSGDRFRVSF